MGSATLAIEQVEQVSGRVRILVGGNRNSLVRTPEEPAHIGEAPNSYEQESTLLFERLAYEGTFMLDGLKIEHPEWFNADLQYPAEDSSIPDLADLEIADLE